MKIFSRIDELPSLEEKTATAIGVFDGLHLGHQKILSRLVTTARKHRLLSAVLTFFPHPENILSNTKIPLIQTLKQRLEGIKQFGVDAVFCLSFDQTLSNFPAEEFVRIILLERLKASWVVVGENFHFGKDRQGNISLLRRLGEKFGYRAISIPAVTFNGQIVSSSSIRHLLEKGKIQEANALLGRCYEIEGKVIRGRSRGKRLGFPTANIHSENEILPQGVFLTIAKIEWQSYPSLTNIGTCPTFDQKELTIETYIIDYHRQMYEEKIRLHFIQKLRDEKKFPRAQALAAQIKSDLKAAKEFFNKACFS